VLCAVCCVLCAVMELKGQGRVTCVGMKEAHVEPPLPITDAVVQYTAQLVVIATLWIFSMRAAADGALLLSAWLEVILLRHHCLHKDWPYSLVAGQVCCFCFRVDCNNCDSFGFCFDGGKKTWGIC
jgi:hypothetical protein